MKNDRPRMPETPYERNERWAYQKVLGWELEGWYCQEGWLDDFYFNTRRVAVAA